LNALGNIVVDQPDRVGAKRGIVDMMKRVAMIAAMVALANCGGSKDASVSIPDGKGGSTKIETSGETSTIKTADGSTTTISSGAANANFPAYAPQYPGATLGEVSNISSDAGSMTTAVMTTPDAPDKVLAFYKEKLTAGGVPVGVESKSPEMSMLMAGDGMPGLGSDTKGVMKGLSAAVTAKPVDGGTEISLVLNAPAK
jgi:hypothetical protein